VAICHQNAHAYRLYLVKDPYACKINLPSFLLVCRDQQSLVLCHNFRGFVKNFEIFFEDFVCHPSQPHHFKLQTPSTAWALCFQRCRQLLSLEVYTGFSPNVKPTPKKLKKTGSPF
jgi:hypothetical protein